MSLDLNSGGAMLPLPFFIENCERFPGKVFFTFYDHEGNSISADGRTLVSKIREVGSYIQERVAVQEKIFLLLPQHSEFLYAVLGCLYANVAAIPGPVADTGQKQKIIEKILPIIKDSNAKYVITNKEFKTILRDNTNFDTLTVIDIEEVHQEPLTVVAPRAAGPEDTAMLLYTSGSTSDPKGVVVTHRSMICQAQAGAAQWEIGPESVIVSWMPQFHNFGFNFNFAAPLLKGASSIILAPSFFVKDPERWLRLISENKATHTAAPNFAFDYCCASIDITSLKEVRLQSVKAIICGGEPVRKETYENFISKFQQLGLDKNSFCPHYGLSECGALTSKRSAEPLRFLALDIEALGLGRVQYSKGTDKAKYIASCGRIPEDIKIVIVQQETGNLCPQGVIGEIWVKSSASGKGYLNKEEDTKKVFFVGMNTGEERFLRTGDLGFIEDNHLYIAGREKEVIIIHGKNHYPVDIEWTVKKYCPALRLSVAVFSKEIDHQEKLLIVQEVEDDCDHHSFLKISQEIVSCISENHQAEVNEVVLVKKGSIPKTESGKIQRRACKNKYLSNSLPILFRFSSSENIHVNTIEQPAVSNYRETLEVLKKEVFLSVLSLSVEQLEKAETLSELGLDSLKYVQISKRIEEVFQISFAPAMLFKHRKFEELAAYLNTQVAPAEVGEGSRATKLKRSAAVLAEARDKDIAIIGMMCNFPGGAVNPSLLWENLIRQRDCISPITQSRPEIIERYRRTYGTVADKLKFPAHAGFIEGTDVFDASFFGISPIEAESMDPQQRKLLEATWHVIEDGGYNPSSLSGKDIGLFVGVHNIDYAELFSGNPMLMETYGAYLDSGVHMSMISHRVSRWFNFHGPSEVINTACSSSLVAIHHAVESIRQGESSMAIAGGINIILSPRIFCASQRAGMLAEDGRCKTFDQKANGFVRSEGYGMVLLKSLKKAQEDNDTIYAVIKSAAINHDGQSNSLRAPNLNAQKQLVKKAYQEAGISPDTVTYIETHGTGTALGDPIEIQALKEAFQELQPGLEGGYCGLGTIKTNIGHCESAAGIAGVIKLVWSLRHKVLPGILHFGQLNPYIKLENSPFRIAEKQVTWNRTRDKEGRELPLRAGVSSFGFGGANAHVLLEEYPVDETVHEYPPVNESRRPVIIPLSARSRESLTGYIKSLITFLGKVKESCKEKGSWQESQFLESFAYTLQTGRNSMELRAVLIVNDITDAVEKLKSLEGNVEAGAANVWQGQEKLKEAERLAGNDDDALIEKWLRKQLLDKVAQYWVNGGACNWELLYEHGKPRRISLPGYAFSHKRYWIEEVPGDTREAAVENKDTERLHPLLHKNISDLSRQQFSTLLTGDAFFLKDHVIQGRKVLPGAAYLEMAYAATEISRGDKWPGLITFKNLRWLKPIVVDAAFPVNVALTLSGKDTLKFEITGTSSGDVSNLYCEGQASFISSCKGGLVDVTSIRSQCDRILSSEEFYNIFSELGIAFGPAHQAVTELYIHKDWALARLALPISIQDTKEQYTLHPSMIDAAIQASMGLMVSSGRVHPSILYQIEELVVYSKCTASMWAYVRFAPESKARDSFRKLDIDLCNDDGAVCVSLKGVDTRTMKNVEGSQESASLPLTGALMLSPVWERASLPVASVSSLPEGVLVIGGHSETSGFVDGPRFSPKYFTCTYKESIEELSSMLDRNASYRHFVWQAPQVSGGSCSGESVISEQERGLIALYRFVKALLSQGYGTRSISVTVVTWQSVIVVPGELHAPVHAGLHGFAGSLSKEYRSWEIRVSDVEHGVKVDEAIFQLPTDGEVYAFRGDVCYVQRLLQAEASETSGSMYRRGGVYVVIGGAGGLGEVWSKALIRNYGAQIIWIGRRSEDREIEEKRKRLGELGPMPVYKQADARDYASLARVYEEIKSEYGLIHGVVHSAVGVLDQSIAGMDEGRFREVLSAKVDVSVRIEQVFGQIPLDFVLFFSSINSFTKDAGKISYTAGCTFKDSFAAWLSGKWNSAVKVMNWGYWGDVIGVGSMVPDSFKKRLAREGIVSISPEEGLKALKVLLNNPFSQMAFIKVSEPLKLPVVKETEQLKVYRAEIPSVIEKLGDISSSRRGEAERIRREVLEPMEALEDLLHLLLVSELEAAGLLEGVYTAPMSASFYERWFAESLRALSAIGYIQQEGKRWKRTAACGSRDRSGLWAEWSLRKQEWSKDASLHSQVILLDETLRSLDGILSGRIKATDVLFPNSSMRLVEGIYKRNAIADYYNGMLCDALMGYLSAREQEETLSEIRILEIGAGTGGTSAMVFERLSGVKDRISEYCYTDISKAFLQHGEQQYGASNPYLRYKLYNAEEEAGVQGLEEGVYDVVIATNVLHATSSIGKTLGNAKQLLKCKGILLLNEISVNRLSTHLTFGLLPGWWKYEDGEVRIPGSPGLGGSQWADVLALEGYAKLEAISKGSEDLGHQVLMAESNGVVRKKRKTELKQKEKRSAVPVVAESNSRPRTVKIAAGQNAALDAMLRDRASAYFRKLVAQALRINVESIDSAESLEEYGIDSILVVQITNTLNEVFGNVSSTLLFECQTIDSLVEHFIRNRKETLINLTGLDSLGGSLSAEEELEGADEREEKPYSGAEDIKYRFLSESPENPEAKKVYFREPIAIIGMSGRYPQADTIEEYWENLKAGKDCITEVPEERWSIDGFYLPGMQEAIAKGMSYSKWGGFINGFADFDPLFFNISPKEAISIDPQERLFLQEAWRALEDAGYTRERLAGEYNHRVGVFAGITKTGFELFGPELWKEGEHIFPRTSFSSVANRISYLLNLKGPSLPIDTMCSSSLTAIHEACEYLYRGECEMAIVGGVNVYLHPSSYVALSAQQMLSPDGQCKTFGADSNGFVPGEGVGVFVLKPLSRAERDGDPIHAVIRSTSINHGGKTNGYTIPNPAAHAELIRDAIEKGGIDARTISYIEAHGTGTELGDPIEVTGLSHAFQKDTKDNQFCAIGSVKSNIGHLEAAAGIAGLTKIVLQLKNNMLVSSLHADVLNPKIDFEQSPFVVQQRSEEWKRPVLELQGEVKEFPRIAGISSFGAGGSNAHVIIEEYSRQSSEAEKVSSRNIALIVLSARNTEALKMRVRQLVEFLSNTGAVDIPLERIAYTLQTGREAMEERLAVIACSVKELLHKLKDFMNGVASVDLYQGQVKRNKEFLAILAEDEELHETVEKWFHKGKYGKVLDLWVRGFKIDWNKLYIAAKPRRISLPGYPFAKERYWIADRLGKNTRNVTSKVKEVLHPLLHENTSTLSRQQFSSSFSGEERFIRDHIVAGQPMFPGSFLLETARVAAMLSTERIGPDTQVILKDFACNAAAVIKGALHTALYAEEDRIDIELYGKAVSDGEEDTLYGGCKAVIAAAGNDGSIDVEAIRKRCSKNTVSGSACFEFLRKFGMEYGSSYHCIEQIQTGENELLMRLSLSSDAAGEGQVFYPVFADAVLTYVLFRILGDSASKEKLSVGFREIQFFEECPARVWAYLKYTEPTASDDHILLPEIDFCDDSGKIIISIKGISIDVKESAVSSVNEENGKVGSEPGASGLMTFEEVWEESRWVENTVVRVKTVICFIADQEQEEALSGHIHSVAPEVKLIFVYAGENNGYSKFPRYTVSRRDRASYAGTLQKIADEHGQADALLYLWPLKEADTISDYSIPVYILEAVATSRLKTPKVILAGEFTNDIERCYLDSWIGFERSFGLVSPAVRVGVILQEKGAETSLQWAFRLWNELRTPEISNVLYKDDKRHICKIRETFISSSEGGLKMGGTYLITGGFGGLGYLFAAHLSTAYKANLILTGRSPLTGEKQTKLKALEGAGSRVHYIQSDAADKEAMNEGLKNAKRELGAIQGVIHAAGLEGGGRLLGKDMSEFRSVLLPKVEGTLWLDELLQEDPLDFICYFSSTAAILGDFGACAYAIANRFQMAYANCSTAFGRRGKTVAINWPLWRNGGMGFEARENATLYLKTTGQQFLESADGISIFEKILASDKKQQMVLTGDRKHIERFLALASSESVSRPNITAGMGWGRSIDMKGLSPAECLELDLKRIIGDLLQIPADKLTIEENLSDFGFDSISLARFAAGLSKHFNLEVSPALFFAYSSIERLRHYFTQEHRTLIEDFYKENSGQTMEEKKSFAVRKEQPVRKVRQTSVSVGRETGIPEPIAIIGMSGRFPGARNIEALWATLCQGKDVVQEIPEERFDWRAYYDPQGSPGKTNSKWCGFLPGEKEFDPLFFEISPKEAELMDPRQRLLLQETWQALEDAGYGPSHLSAGRVGIFAGVEEGDYHIVSGKGSITSNHTAILGARLSYFLNLSGPNMAINTACSSGLVAAHQACQSLRNRECDTAIAAAVNLILTPQRYIEISEAGMLSPEGKCYAFDKRANGIVPGEAAVAFVLKRLSDAEADGDPVYAVIRGSGINYDGKTNGITAPNGLSQSQLMESIYGQYKIDPSQIGYIVTHGTGTRLGDPVEVTALQEAFKKYNIGRGYCALTSAKSNLGHTFAASGLVSLVNLVRSLETGLIPASLHCQEESDYISWESSPFYVNKSLREWKQSSRVGAVSSFGMSGTNAHMVVSNYAGQEQTEALHSSCYLLTLSARTSESLGARVRELLEYFEHSPESGGDLSRLSYTLQQGRHHFSHRCAVVAGDREEAMHLLRQYLSSSSHPQLFRGQVSRDFAMQKSLLEYGSELLGKAYAHRMERKVQQEHLQALAGLYTQGYNFSWAELYGNRKVTRMHLPGYPFSREEYWSSAGTQTAISKQTSSVKASSSGKERAQLHALLHANTSDFERQHFSSLFSSSSAHLQDHRIQGQVVLAGVAQAEMARAALWQSISSLREGKQQLRLKQVVWKRPVVVDIEQEIHTEVYPLGDGQYGYEIYSEGTEGAQVHGEGKAVLLGAGESPEMDIEKLKAGCSSGRINKKECYGIYSSMGLEYGPMYRCVEEIYRGSGEVLARLMLEPSAAGTLRGYHLHPGLLDSALQASVGLHEVGESRGASVPFSVEVLDIYAACQEKMWAYVRYSAGSRAGDKVEKLDIDLLDESGKVCVSMKGFTARVLDKGSDRAVSSLLLHPVWQEESMEGQAERISNERHIVLLAGACSGLKDRLGAAMGESTVHELETAGEDIGQRYSHYSRSLFDQVKVELLSGRDKVLIQLVLSGGAEESVFEGLSGLLKSASLESSRLRGQVLWMDAGDPVEEIVSRLRVNAGSAASEIRYEAGIRHVHGWEPLEIPASASALPWKDGGVYLITGGAGGLGLLFAGEIARSAGSVNLILTGRSSSCKGELLDDLRAQGAQVEYIQNDVSDRSSVEGLMSYIVERYGKLNGIIHSAGVIRDNYIIRKEQDEFLSVLRPKVEGVVHLDEASREMDLDWMILFSSIAGSLGNGGQSDYSAGNSFMDRYAEYRNGLAAQGMRKGHTLSINWPLWKEGGMKVDQATEQLLAAMGLDVLESDKGMNAFYRGIASGKKQVMVLQGEPTKLENLLKLRSSREQKAAAVQVSPQKPGDTLKSGWRDFVLQSVSTAIKLSPDKIDTAVPFEKYGIDSLLQVSVLKELEKLTGELPRTLLFEHTTIDELTEYLFTTYGGKIEEQLQPEKEELPLMRQDDPAAHHAHDISFSRKASAALAQDNQKDSDSIAIIGISGKYPQSESLNALWENLHAGRNCITEVPHERWQSNFFSAKDKSGPDHKKIYGGFLENIDKFDNHLFDIEQDKVMELSPEQRLFLETVWETFEDAGYTRQSIQDLQDRHEKGVGVFVGTMYSQYAWSFPITEQGVLNSNSTDWQIANRTSHFFNLTGPSLAVNSACSGSLTAIHLACESLKQKNSIMAVAGGVNLTLHPSKYEALESTQFLGSGDQSKSFGASNGYIPGEGVGAVLLKSLAQAQADGDRIYAVIKSSFINHSGGRQTYSAPDPKQQAQLIIQSIKRAGIDPTTIGYVESAANGSALGDPIEVIALNQAFSRFTDRKQFCALGSVKSNLGHLEAASGISQLSKVLLQMKHRTLVPTLHATPVNPHIRLDHTAFYLQQEVGAWEPITDDSGNKLPRRSMINSFGAGGAYANIIVEEYTTSQKISINGHDHGEPFVFIFSAQNTSSLFRYLEKIHDLVRKDTHMPLAALAASLIKLNHGLPQRVAIIASSSSDLLHKIDLLCVEKRTMPASGIFLSHKEHAEAAYNLNHAAAGPREKAAWEWIKGRAVRWENICDYRNIPRISLPLYAFDHDAVFRFDHAALPKQGEDGEENFYQDLLVRISNEELSEEEFRNLITGI